MLVFRILLLSFRNSSVTLRDFVATLRVAGSLQKSTEVMHMMQNLIKVPEIATTIRNMSKEMMKVLAGLPIIILIFNLKCSQDFSLPI